MYHSFFSFFFISSSFSFFALFLHKNWIKFDGNSNSLYYLIFFPKTVWVFSLISAIFFFIVCIMKFWQRKYFAVIACHWHWHRHRHCHGSSINVIVIWSIFLQYIYTLLCSATCIFWNWSERWTRYYNHNFERFNDGENEQFCIHLIIMISHFLFVDVVVDFYPYLFVNIISTHFLSLLFRLLLRWIYFGEVADTNEKWLRKNTTTKYIDW